MTQGSRSKRTPFPGTDPAFDTSAELPVQPVAPRESSGIAGDAEARAPKAPVTLIPVGDIDLAIVELVRPYIEDTFRRPIHVAGGLPVPKYAYNPTRGQFHSAAILKRVESYRSTAWDAAVGFVNVDLFVPETPFIFGEADRSTRSAIISLNRLRDGSPLDTKDENFVRRLASETIHQIGLIRGLAQCPNNRCVMFPSTTIPEIDKKGLTLCANCRKRLAALD